MSTELRALNRAGIGRFRAYLERLRQGDIEPPPRALLDDPVATEALPEAIDVEPRSFPHRLALGEYLHERLTVLPSATLDRNAGLWAWLSLFWFDQVCPPRDNGSRRPGRDYRHIPDFTFQHQHRHLLLGSYQVYRRHKAIALVLLSGPLHEESGIYHEIASRRDLIANRGVMEAALRLYIDPHRGTLKRGAQAHGGAPGTVRRFVRVLQQFDLTYDIYGLTGRELLDLLPPEFDPWRPAFRLS